MTPKGSFEECVANYVRQGLGVRQALDQCNFKDLEVGKGGGFDPGGLIPRRGASGKDIKVVCKDATKPFGPNPAVAETWNFPSATPNYGDPTQRELTPEEKEKLAKKIEKDLAEAKEKEQKTKDAEAQAYDAYDKALKNNAKTPEGDPNKKLAEEDEKNKFRDYLEKTVDAWNATKERERLERMQANPPTHTPPLISRVSPDAENSCQEVAEFIAQCNDNGWRTFECQLFLSRMDNCGDPRLTHPAPGETETCHKPRIPLEEVKKVIVARCQKVTRPVPGEHPCEEQQVDATITRYFLKNPKDPNSVKGSICSDPHAYVQPESCMGTFNLVAFGEKDFQKIIEWGREKFGGPPAPHGYQPCKAWICRGRRIGSRLEPPRGEAESPPHRSFRSISYPHKGRGRRCTRGIRAKWTTRPHCS